MITLDEEMSACERLIRINVDSARISEDRVGWLLNFNKYQVRVNTAYENKFHCVMLWIYTNVE